MMRRSYWWPVLLGFAAAVTAVALGLALGVVPAQILVWSL